MASQRGGCAVVSLMEAQQAAAIALLVRGVGSILVHLPLHRAMSPGILRLAQLYRL